MTNEWKSVRKTSLDLELPVIMWVGNKLLKWSDFKKKPELKDITGAVAAIGFKTRPLIEYIKIGSKFKFKIREMELDAIFIPDFSWVMKNINKNQRRSLLKHEQGHFDLAEEIIKKTRIKLNTYFQNKVFSVKATNGGEKKEEMRHINKIRKEIEEKLQKEFRIQEEKYDKKTNHGLIIKYQNEYNERFKKLRK